MELSKLSPFGASGKNFQLRVNKADNATIRAAWEKWDRSYSKNQARMMRARLARMNSRSPEPDPRGELDEQLYR